jgi:hypothetical protein
MPILFLCTKFKKKNCAELSGTDGFLQTRYQQKKKKLLFLKQSHKTKNNNIMIPLIMFENSLDIVAIIIALIIAVVAMFVIVPDRKREKLKGFMRTLHDFFNFKKLWIEWIFKSLYIACTLFCIIDGLLNIFSNFWAALLIMIGGVLVVRIVFEISMLFILLVQNTIDINKKMKMPEK